MYDMCGFVLYKYMVPRRSQVGNITFAHMQRLQPTGACFVCMEGLDDKSESDDYYANLDYWEKNRPPGEAASLEWDMHRPVIMHPIDIVPETGLPSKIHWMCHGCLYKVNPMTHGYYTTQCPLCNNRQIDRGNMEPHAEPQAVPAELDPELVAQLSRPLPYYHHPHPQSDENITVRWYREQGLLDLEERQLQVQRDEDAQRLVELEARQQRERDRIEQQEQEQRQHELDLAEHQRNISRERQRQHAHAQEEERLNRLREMQYRGRVELRERHRRNMERARQERNHNRAARQKPPPNTTVFSQWKN